MEKGERRIEQEQPEELVVTKADTVSDPRTMMVHLHYTSAAKGTVMSSRWLHFIALETELKLVEVAQLKVRRSHCIVIVTISLTCDLDADEGLFFRQKEHVFSLKPGHLGRIDIVDVGR